MRGPLLWRALLFTLLIPGVVTVLVPYMLYPGKPDFEMGGFKYGGILLGLCGLCVYSWCVAAFALKGKGTPVIWWAHIFHWIIGKEPICLVQTGLYRFSRNPMYVGVVFFVLGQGLFFRSWPVIIYAICLFGLFHCVVVFIEEPRLHAKFGEAFLNYKNKVPRWF